MFRPLPDKVADFYGIDKTAEYQTMIIEREKLEKRLSKKSADLVLMLKVLGVFVIIISIANSVRIILN